MLTESALPALSALSLSASAPPHAASEAPKHLLLARGPVTWPGLGRKAVAQSPRAWPSLLLSREEGRISGRQRDDELHIPGRSQY